MGAKEVGLVEIDADAAVERRPARVDAGRSRPAEEVHVVILGVDAGLLFGAVADAEVHALMIALRDRDTDRHVLGLLLRVDRLDVRELEQLEPVEAPLRVLDDAAAVEIAGLECQLPADDVFPDALVADHFERTEVRHRPRLRREGQRRLLRVAGVVLAGRHLRVGIAVIAQLVERQLVGRDDELAVARLPDLEGQVFFHLRQVVRRDDVEAGEVDRFDRDRFALGDGDRQVDRVLLVVELDVESCDARVGEAAIGVEGLNPLQVGIESRTIEVGLLAPRDPRALMRRERGLQARFVHVLDAVE